MGRYEAKADLSKVISVHADALSRAWRTLWVAIGADVTLAIGMGLLDLLGKVEISALEFWIGFAVLIAKSFLTALGTYWARRKITPMAEKQRELFAPVDELPKLG